MKLNVWQLVREFFAAHPDVTFSPKDVVLGLCQCGDDRVGSPLWYYSVASAVCNLARSGKIAKLERAQYRWKEA